MRTLARLVLPAALVLAPAAVFAQTPAPASPAPATAAPATDGSATATPATPDMPSLELETRPDGYTYNPQGRRDPFVNLLRRDKAEASGPKPPGIAGLSINEVALRGVVKDSVQGYIALLLGPTGSTYFCKVGQRLYDGTITAIDAATVTFRQEVTDPLSRDKTRDVKKTLYPAEEASK